MKNLNNELEELRTLLDVETLPSDLNTIGMKDFSQEEFQDIFDFIEILAHVQERVRKDRREEILKHAA